MSSIKISVFACAAALLSVASALGINCRGSGLCDFASLEDNSGVNIIQLWHNVLNASTADDSTTYSNGDHVVCIGTSATITVGAEAGAEMDGLSGTLSLSTDVHIGNGGVCLFPQHMADGATITLGSIRALADAIGEHGCTTCGSVPIHFVDQNSNDPKSGILTSNYVKSPFCAGNCINSVGS